MGYIVEFVGWISRSDFFRLQRPEPTVGGPQADYPDAVEEHGIKGRSVYTAIFHNLDMEIFTCKLCSYEVKGELEDAIIHQRVAHFRHYPYQCSGTQTQWYASCSPFFGSVSRSHFNSAGCASQAKQRWRSIKPLPGTRSGLQRYPMIHSYKRGFSAVSDCPQLILCACLHCLDWSWAVTSPTP